MGALAIQPFSIRILDPAQWGRVGLSTVILQVGQVILSAGLPLAITRAFYNPDNGPLHARAINGANIVISLILSVLAAVAVGATLPAGSDSFAFVWAMIAVGLLSTVVSAQSVLRAQQRPMAFILLSGGSSLGSHALGLLAIVAIAPTASVYLCAFTVGMAATAVWGMALTRPVWPGKAWAAVREAFAIGLPVMPHSLAMILLMQGDSFLLQFFQDPASVGRYIAAAAFALGPFSVLSGLNNVWTPRIMAAAHGEGFGAEIRTVARQAALISGAIAIGGSAVATLGIYVLKGHDPVVIQLAKVLPTVAGGYALYLIAMSVMFAVKRTAVFAVATPLIAVLAGALAWLPAQGNQLVLLGVVKSAAFAMLGLVFLWLVTRTSAPAVPVRGFVAVMALSWLVSGALLLVPATLVAGVVVVLATAVAAAAAAILYFKVRWSKSRKPALMNRP